MRTITYAVATENGRYNSSFRWDRVQAYLDFMSLYFPIQFERISNFSAARYRIVNGTVSGGSRVAATTSASQRRTKISNVFPFGQSDYWCAKVIIHEFGHCLNTSIVHLSGGVDIMTASAGTAHNFTQRDCDNFYAKAYGWLGSRRPWNEPNLMRETFSPALRTMADGEEEHCECTCGGKQTILGRIAGLVLKADRFVP
jgi:hypothetical protein